MPDFGVVRRGKLSKFGSPDLSWSVRTFTEVKPSPIQS
ncbi:hypothetical protein NC99_05650 [Sunxiuqinia dokdonensis]|uniref:Uncharacterized protein n=1 Tax=Sunxiuqinia dokdonensis TaxID=1409788 RepID=A0A0L8VDZ3_9BACT|nr:hypothetical protein NC99_05650 [Sunxiuqinia dokdonensis]